MDETLVPTGSLDVQTCSMLHGGDTDTESLVSGQQHENSRNTGLQIGQTNDRPIIRAKSARELVKSQEHLLNLLQAMKSDLSKMDREASAIKEDIVRSNQLFHVMVKLQKTHHLQPLPGGYNISHALPKVSYQRHSRNTDKELRNSSIKHLNQLSTYRPEFLSEYRSINRSSFSSTISRDYDESYRSVTPSSGLYGSRRSSDRSTQSNSSTDGSYSGNSATESEIDSTTSRELSRVTTSSDISPDSTSTYDEGGSSTESVRTQDRNPVGLNVQTNIGRRPSYYYTTRVETPPHAQSDEIDM